MEHIYKIHYTGTVLLSVKLVLHHLLTWTNKNCINTCMIMAHLQNQSEIDSLLFFYMLTMEPGNHSHTLL